MKFPSLRQLWFQLHWLIGITAGTVLIVIGLSGAVLSFREEIIDAINPHGRHVPVQAVPSLTPPQLLAAARQAWPQRQVGTLALFAEPGAAARVIFAPPPGERRGETVYLDPYTGTAMPPLAGAGFFEWVEALHRWLLLPREPGRVVAGVLAMGLLLLSLSGLYLRWPRRPLDWRAWLTFDPALKGRSFLWGLHSVMGTGALLMYVVFTTSGLYWAFDALRDRVDAMAGHPRVAAQQARTAPRMRNVARDDAAAVDVAPAWAAFERKARETGGWSEVILRVPSGAAPSVLFTWLDVAPPHERARNRMTVRLPGGEVTQDERHADKSAGGIFLAAIYPLHMGTYFGLPGRIAMMLAALMLPVFSVTGWLLYLDRRRKKRAVRIEREALESAARPAGATEPAPARVLVAFASQSGTAEGIAMRSAAALEGVGLPVTVASLARLDPEQLRHHEHLLIVASSFGEGGPPDTARRFAQRLAQVGGEALSHLRYGLLALGDRHYARFCGFGHALDHALVAAGAQSLFPMVEVDNGDAGALAVWRRHLGAMPGARGDSVPDAMTVVPEEEPFVAWTLSGRRLLNPGSLGHPLCEIELMPAGQGGMPSWRPGALVELLPRHAPEAVGALLRSASLDGDAVVRFQGRAVALHEALTRSAMPAPELLLSRAPDAQALADALVPLASRRYSIASVPAEGRIRLLVRQARHESGLGLASGWLTVHAPPSAQVELRLLANPGFEPVADERPCIFIGNGSGYAGLRGHLRERMAQGFRRNWLLFGERHSAHDAFFMDELAQWREQGLVARADLAFSRDQPERIYVQDRLREAASELQRWIGDGAVVFVCGSLHGMAAGVDAVLEEVLGRPALEDLIAQGRYRRDVY
ncbi:MULTISPECIES: sulfite reductase flavoprotein subunit alpha [Variovorax]|jgi:sulfite reductase (NADPH) flavoprotein alpha-component|uniref:sulfite reductase flavoprotein subunit alpha n=1 Tax=Variovorax TaxID=34072 RepID=UPI00086C6719|nr:MULTISPECIES: sulfite reductase flavoprotein subunit alpha [Variovorax]MBN8753966.1 sulfite reductase flavoprotein subunit alpha [Variovorax sp.]ODU15331.1 MAG: nitric oxide synthase [Variovorax sp. SCN 67-85]ODV24099.1 MAG: nitric oxide synthase [Variovorax sp. SCN 67-20]OJZ04686.1 MAG: nitric oxide synthase [Variovorax sp. 67-131]UKI09890.1 sulfite reductase flavoprotein subunit alpha [Variovorax paradoxus]